jgi:hypothetical protein
MMFRRARLLSSDRTRNHRAHAVSAVAAAAGVATHLHAADLSALGLLRQIVEEHAAQQTFHCNEHLVHVAVRQRDDPYTLIGELPVQRGAIGEVSAEPIQALCQDRIEEAGLSRAHQVL